ncbi:hypothetical protein D7Y05_03885 [bacterium 1XD42-54]|nr:hypothetical protein D7Y05_03885 [bacterium 1XD42-54]
MWWIRGTHGAVLVWYGLLYNTLVPRDTAVLRPRFRFASSRSRAFALALTAKTLLREQAPGRVHAVNGTAQC